MIGQRVRINQNDGPIKTGTEGVVVRLSPGFINKITAYGPVWDVDFPNYTGWAIYQNWLEVVDTSPEEYEDWFV